MSQENLKFTPTFQEQKKQLKEYKILLKEKFSAIIELEMSENRPMITSIQKDMIRMSYNLPVAHTQKLKAVLDLVDQILTTHFIFFGSNA